MFEQIKQFFYTLKYRRLARTTDKDIQDFVLHNQVLPGKVVSFQYNIAEVICEINSKYYLLNVIIQKRQNNTSCSSVSLQQNQLVFVYIHNYNTSNTFDVSMETFDKKIVIPDKEEPKEEEVVVPSTPLTVSPPSSDYEVV